MADNTSTGAKGGDSTSFKVFVIGAKGLASFDTFGGSDPFVVVDVVSPAASKPLASFKTAVKKSNLSPEFKEGFEVKVPGANASFDVQLNVFDFDAGSENDFMGRVILPGDVIKQIVAQGETVSRVEPLAARPGKKPKSFEPDPKKLKGTLHYVVAPSGTALSALTQEHLTAPTQGPVVIENKATEAKADTPAEKPAEATEKPVESAAAPAAAPAKEEEAVVAAPTAEEPVTPVTTAASTAPAAVEAPAPVVAEATPVVEETKAEVSAPEPVVETPSYFAARTEEPVSYTPAPVEETKAEDATVDTAALVQAFKPEEPAPAGNTMTYVAVAAAVAVVGAVAYFIRRK